MTVAEKIDLTVIGLPGRIRIDCSKGISEGVEPLLAGGETASTESMRGGYNPNDIWLNSQSHNLIVS